MNKPWQQRNLEVQMDYTRVKNELLFVLLDQNVLI